MVADQLQALLDETNALDLFQSGFRPCHGTETALVALMDDVLREADWGKMSLLVLLDISAAFDTVNHGILLGRLSALRIGGLALAWLQSYFKDLPQRVQLGRVSRLRGFFGLLGHVLKVVLPNVSPVSVPGIFRGQHSVL